MQDDDDTVKGLREIKEHLNEYYHDNPICITRITNNKGNISYDEIDINVINAKSEKYKIPSSS